VSHARRAIILARGLGTRMRAHDARVTLTADQQRAADAGHKAMMPIHGRPFLDYAISAVADAGVDRVALVVAPDADALRRYYEDVAPPSRVRLEFVVQPEARGTADAVLCAQAWTDGQPFLAMNSDNLYPISALRDLVALDEPGLPGFEADDLVRTSNIPRERIASFALLDVDTAGYLRSIVEKPGSPSYPSRPSYPSLVSMNVWRFDPRIFDACRDVRRSARGEFELPEAVGLAVARGVPFRVVSATGPVLDLSRRADAADVERRLDGVEPRP
jgi:glucose-1-phosphate thymidylyltransferase